MRPGSGASGRARALLPALAMLCLFAPAAATPENDAARAFLGASFEVTDAEFARIQQGHVVSRTMDGSDKREVATLGVVRVRITPEFYVEQLADIVRFKTSDGVLQIGTFGAPPDLRDVSLLTLDDSDIRSLRECQVGDCGVQLSAAAIVRFRQEVDWRRPDADQQANALMRRILVDYVSGYLKSGMAGCMQYADEARPVNLSREFASLIESMESRTGGLHQFPALRRHLFDYPAADTANTTDLVYWSKEKVGRRTVASVTHMAISRTAGESPADYAVASKHIYGTHYFDASLGLTFLVRDRSTSAPAMYVAYVNRSRVDVFRGVFGGLTRKIVSSKARATVSDHLAQLQRGLERQFAALPPK